MGEYESEMKKKHHPTSSSWSSFCFTSCFRTDSVSSDRNKPEKRPENSQSSTKREPGGWKAISFILGNETFERLASFGLLANFMVYLTTELHLDQVSASNIMNIWSGVTNFAPLVGAFISDAYAGRFWTIAFASFASLMGMATVTLTAWLPQLHPPSCKKELVSLGQCKRPNKNQLGILILGLGFLSIGSGGIRPCSIPFGVDQFDPTTDEGRKGINSFFNWFFDKAAIVQENELNPNGTPINKWRLCSVEQVEELKCIVRITPIWAAGIISLTAMVQQGTFTISQALKMDRHLGPKFEIPAGSISVISLITIGLWLPFYDRILVPYLRKITKQEAGITLLQRIGIGLVFSILSMVAAGLVEKERRAFAKLNPNRPMSVFWLAPQLIMMGFCEAFNMLGQIEFFNRQFPEHMRSIGNALFSCSFAGASYVSSLLVSVVHRITATRDRPDWLTDDLNAGRLDYFYYLLAGLGVLNLVYFLYVARRYRYKGSSDEGEVEGEKQRYVDVELSSTKA